MRARNPVALCFFVSRKLLFQLSQRLPVKNQLRRDAHQVFLSQENLQEFLCPLGFDRKFCQHLFTDGTARLAEANAASICSLALASSGSRAFQIPLFLRVLLARRVSSARQFFQRGAESFASHALAQAGAQILARDSRNKGFSF